MISENKLVSIIINCYNGEKYLKETLVSIVNQTYPTWEIVFYDNISTDKSAEIFKSYKDNRFKYFLANKHTGLGQARLNAIKFAKGDYLAFLDCDDLWLKDKLKFQLDLFNEDDVGIVISNTMFFNNTKSKALYNLSKYPPEGFVFESILKNYLISLETIIFRKEAINSIKKIQEMYIYNHIFDFVLVLNVLINWKLKIKKKILAKWRVHNESESFKDNTKFLKEYKLFIKRFPMSNSNIVMKYQNSWNFFINKVTQYEIISLIKNKKNYEARNVYNKIKFKNMKLLILYLFTFIPLNNRILNIIQKYRNINPN